MTNANHGLDAAENYVGTCQICFGSYAVNGKNATVYLHGYRRPGHGSTEGRCPGEGGAPFEIGKVLTESFRDRTEASVKHLSKLLAELKAGPIELQVEVPDFDKPVRIEGWRRVQPTKHVVVHPGEQTESERWNGKPVRFVTFQQHLDAKVHRVTADLREEEGTLAFLVKKLAGWRYCPESMPTKAKADLELARAQRATLDARKAASQAKKDAKAARATERLQRATDTVNGLLAQPAFAEYLEHHTPAYGRFDNHLVHVWWLIQYVRETNPRYASDVIMRTQSLASDLKRYAKDARQAGFKVRG